MTPVAVVEASNGAATLADTEGKSISPGRAKATAPHCAGAYEFRAFFNFDNDKLDAVSLEFVDVSQCRKLGFRPIADLSR
jgi:hypothetical protein